MAFYARRRITNQITDDMIDVILRSRGAANELPPLIFVLPEKKFDPHGHDRLFEIPSALKEPQVVETEACGNVYLFDGIQRDG